MKKRESTKVKKGTNEDARFNQLKDHIATMRIVQESNIAHLAMINPNNLSHSSQFRACVEKFHILDRVLDKAEKIEAA